MVDGVCVQVCMCSVCISPPPIPLKVFEDLHTYMQSLSKLQSLSPTLLYPGHGPIVRKGAEKIQQYIDHRMERERQVSIMQVSCDLGLASCDPGLVSCDPGLASCDLDLVSCDPGFESS